MWVHDPKRPGAKRRRALCGLPPTTGVRGDRTASDAPGARRGLRHYTATADLRPFQAIEGVTASSPPGWTWCRRRSCRWVRRRASSTRVRDEARRRVRRRVGRHVLHLGHRPGETTLNDALPWKSSPGLSSGGARVRFASEIINFPRPTDQPPGAAVPRRWKASRKPARPTRPSLLAPLGPELRVGHDPAPLAEEPRRRGWTRSREMHERRPGRPAGDPHLATARSRARHDGRAADSVQGILARGRGRSSWSASTRASATHLAPELATRRAAAPIA